MYKTNRQKDQYNQRVEAKEVRRTGVGEGGNVRRSQIQHSLDFFLSLGFYSKNSEKLLKNLGRAMTGSDCVWEDHFGSNVEEGKMESDWD